MWKREEERIVERPKNNVLWKKEKQRVMWNIKERNIEKDTQRNVEKGRTT